MKRFNINQLLQKAIKVHNNGKTQDAQDLYIKILKINPKHPDANHNLGLIELSMNNTETALSLFKLALDVNPNINQFWISYTNSLIEIKRYVEAELICKKAIDLKPDFPEAYYNLALALQELNRLGASELNYRKAIELKPDYAAAHNNLGNVLKNIGKLDEAEVNYKIAISLMPNYSEVYNNLGNVLKDMGKLAEAKINYIKATQLKPNDSTYSFNFGNMLFENRNFNEAIKQFKLSSHPLSQLFLLKCFYQIDEQSNFYNQLDYLLNQGENNAIIGSLISRSKLRYNIDKYNPFCNNPIHYVLKKDLNKRYDFETIFIDGAKHILNNKKIKHKTQDLLKNGIQTSGNLFSQDGLIIEEMKKIIYLEIEKYRSHFKDSEEGFIKNWPRSYDIRGWLIKMKSGGKLSPHIHETGWMSGSIYINVPLKIESDSGNLVVCIDDKENDENKNKKMNIDVVTGSLCFFPASLLHYTVPFKSDEERIVLAFDVIPRHSQ